MSNQQSKFETTKMQTHVPDIEMGNTKLQTPRIFKIDKPKAIRQSKRQREGGLYPCQKVIRLLNLLKVRLKQNAESAGDATSFILTPVKLQLIIETVAREYVELKGLDPEETMRITKVCANLANTQFEGSMSSNARESVSS